MKIKKEYQRERRTVVEDGAEAVFEEEPLKEEQVYFVMDRFGYERPSTRLLTRETRRMHPGIINILSLV